MKQMSNNIKTKILAVDLDGTAVADDGYFGNRTMRAFRAAKEYGYLICFASGRREVDMFKLGDSALISDYQLLNNGGKIIETASKKVLINCCPSQDDYKKLVDFCVNSCYALHILSGMQWFANYLDDRMYRYINDLGLSPNLYKTFSDVKHIDAEGFVAYSDGPYVIDFLNKSNLNLYAVESEPMCFDIQSPGATKWQGLSSLCEILKIDHKDIIAVGNYTNDIDMIVNSGFGIAVADALDSVKEHADYITQNDCNSNVIAEVVETFILQSSLEQAGF